MPENNTTPSNNAPPSDGQSLSFTPKPTAPLSDATVSGVMSSTPIDNRTSSNVALLVGSGMIIIALIIAGAYFYITTKGDTVVEVTPQETIAPQQSEEEITLSELEVESQSLDASVDFSEVEKDIDTITGELETIQ